MWEKLRTFLIDNFPPVPETMEMILDRISSGLSGPPLLSGFVLALANMVPVIGVIMWDWGVLEVVALYWAETLIIGAFNVVRMLMGKGGESGANQGPNRVQSVTQQGTLAEKKVFMIPFFLLHFGLFFVVHGFFIAFLLTGDALKSPLMALPGLFGKVSLLALFIFSLGHLFSFFWNFIGQREYRTTSLREQVLKPYYRIVILHIALLFGACAILLLQTPMILVLVLIVVKIAMDLGYHFFKHGKTGEKSGYESAFPA